MEQLALAFCPKKPYGHSCHVLYDGQPFAVQFSYIAFFLVVALIGLIAFNKIYRRGGIKDRVIYYSVIGIQLVFLGAVAYYGYELYLLSIGQ